MPRTIVWAGNRQAEARCTQLRPKQQLLGLSAPPICPTNVPSFGEVVSLCASKHSNISAEQATLRLCVVYFCSHHLKGLKNPLLREFVGGNTGVVTLNPNRVREGLFFSDTSARPRCEDPPPHRQGPIVLRAGERRRARYLSSWGYGLLRARNREFPGAAAPRPVALSNLFFDPNQLRVETKGRRPV